MKVSELGEFGLVELIAKTINAANDKNAGARQDLIIGIGDDAAAWRGDAGVQLATVDALVENVHFSMDYTTWSDLGWKSLAINLSDIAAMGGNPKYALVSLALPPSTEVDNVIAFYRGMLELAGKFGVAVIGGDTDSAPHISATVTMLGTADNQQNLLIRNSAKPGDLLAVSGSTGNAAGGFRLLSRKLKATPEDAAVLKTAFLRPVPRIVEGKLLARCGVKAAIDVSDGLINDLTHICRASGVGARLELNKIPVGTALRNTFGEHAIELALAGGEDYELLFTGSPEVIGRVKEQAACAVTIIGEITPEKSGPEQSGRIAIFDENGKPVQTGQKGWEHFISK